MEAVRVGIIGGSGIYDIDDVSDVAVVDSDTPWGKPSDKIIVGTLSGVRFAFLPRHARGHVLSPTALNYRANIYALKQLGVEQIISLSAVGSLRPELRPCDFVVPDQLVDLTRHRVSTFFESGIVAHVGMADPFCGTLSALVYDTVMGLDIPAHKGGAYVCIEGPQFSTRAESRGYQQMGYAVIGMTNATEAKLAREAELCYAPLALVTDYDVWKEDETVNLEQILGNLRANTDNAKRFLRAVLPRMVWTRQCSCAQALSGAIVTDPAVMPPDTVERLRLLISRYVK